MKVTAISFSTLQDTDKVRLSVTLTNQGRRATIHRFIDFGTPHSSATADNIRLGKELMIGADVKDAKITTEKDDKDYPSVRVSFPMDVMFNTESSNKPVEWASGISVRQMEFINDNGNLIKNDAPIVLPISFPNPCVQTSNHHMRMILPVTAAGADCNIAAILALASSGSGRVAGL